MRETRSLVKYFLRGGVFLFFLSAWAHNSFAAEQVAVVKEIKGTVEVQLHGGSSWQSASINMPLYPMDTVRTRTNSQAQVVFNAGHTLKLMALATLQVKTPRKPKKKEPKDPPPVSDGKVAFGKVFIKVKKSIGATSSFEIATPSAVVGVRGTLFAVDVDESGDTSCSVLEGTIELGNEGQSVLVAEGQQVEVEAATGEIPGEPSPMSSQEKKEWEEQKEWVEQVEKEVEGKLDTEDKKPSGNKTEEAKTAPSGSTGTTAAATSTSVPTAATTTTTGETTPATSVSGTSSTGETTTAKPSETTTTTASSPSTAEETTTAATTTTSETGTSEPSPDTETTTAPAAEGSEDNFTATDVIVPVEDYSPLNEVTSDSELIKNQESENQGTVFDPELEAAVTPQDAVTGDTSFTDSGTPQDESFTVPSTPGEAVTQEDNVDDASVSEEEVFTQ